MKRGTSGVARLARSVDLTPLNRFDRGRQDTVKRPSRIRKVRRHMGASASHAQSQSRQTDVERGSYGEGAVPVGEGRLDHASRCASRKSCEKEAPKPGKFVAGERRRNERSSSWPKRGRRTRARVTDMELQDRLARRQGGSSVKCRTRSWPGAESRHLPPPLHRACAGSSPNASAARMTSNRSEINRTGKKMLNGKGNGRQSRLRQGQSLPRGRRLVLADAAQTRDRYWPKKVRALASSTHCRQRRGTVASLARQASAKGRETGTPAEEFRQAGSPARSSSTAPSSREFRPRRAPKTSPLDVVRLQGINGYDIVRRQGACATKSALEALEARFTWYDDPRITTHDHLAVSPRKRDARVGAQPGEVQGS